MIRVLVVEDSPVVREFLEYLLRSDPAIEVIGTANDGEEALQAVEQMRPDVITMDIHMPKMNGLEATRRIMQTNPTPIVIVSGSSSAREMANTFHALEAGAVSFVERPRGIGHPDHDASAQEFVRTTKLMSEVKVVRRWSRPQGGAASGINPPPGEAAPEPCTAGLELVAIGASTGGPLVLQTILSSLPSDCPASVLLVQHMAAGFTQGFVDWLAPTSALPLAVAAHGELILPGHVYVAPDGLQMKVTSGGNLFLIPDGPENGHQPSVSYLFRSVASQYGPRAVGILLTGMGRDGADGLKAMRDAGALTIAQDAGSSVVHGMPGEAIRLEAAVHVLAPHRIVATLAILLDKRGALAPAKS